MKHNIKCASWNVQSIRNKCGEVMEHVIDNDADFVFLTETWMESDKNDITANIKEGTGYCTIEGRIGKKKQEVVLVF